MLAPRCGTRIRIGIVSRGIVAKIRAARAEGMNRNDTFSRTTRTPNWAIPSNAIGMTSRRANRSHPVQSTAGRRQQNPIR